MKRASAINPVSTENTDNYRYKCREAIMYYCELAPWAINEEKWDACIICTDALKQCLTVQEPLLSEGISQVGRVSYFVETSTE